MSADWKQEMLPRKSDKHSGVKASKNAVKKVGQGGG